MLYEVITSLIYDGPFSDNILAKEPFRDVWRLHFLVDVSDESVLPSAAEGFDLCLARTRAIDREEFDRNNFV